MYTMILLQNCSMYDYMQCTCNDCIVHMHMHVYTFDLHAVMHDHDNADAYIHCIS